MFLLIFTHISKQHTARGTVVSRLTLLCECLPSDGLKEVMGEMDGIYNGGATAALKVDLLPECPLQNISLNPLYELWPLLSPHLKKIPELALDESVLKAQF